MSTTLTKVKSLVALGHWRPTTHAMRRLQQRDLLLQDAVASLEHGTLIEDYPADPRGPSLLLLSFTSAKLPLHTVWGIPATDEEIVSLITVYVPDPSEWLEDNKTRRTR